MYRTADDRSVEETRRVIGDVLIWRRGEVTLRLESALDRDVAIRLAEGFAAGP